MPHRPVLTELDRRAFLALGAAAATGLGARRAWADDAPKLAEYTSIPDKLKGSGEVSYRRLWRHRTGRSAQGLL